MSIRPSSSGFSFTLGNGMIGLFYIEDGPGKVRFKDSGSIEYFGSFDIRYLVYSGDAASAYFQDLSGNEIARVAIDIKWDREFLDIVRTQNILSPVTREEFIDWLRDNHPDILTYLLWFIA